MVTRAGSARSRVLGVVLIASSLATHAALAAPKPPVRTRSVYQLRPGLDVPVMLAAGLVGLTGLLFRDQLARKSCPCDPGELNALDRRTVGNRLHPAGVASDVAVALSIVAPPLLDYWQLGAGWILVEDLVVFGQAVVVNSAIYQSTAFAVGRPKPRAYAGEPAYVDGTKGYLSFYAGHVSNTFAALSAASYTLRLRYGERVWPWLVTAGVGSGVAVARVAAGAHFPTDVVVGAVMGSAIGITVPWLHARSTGGGVVPVAIPDGVALAGKF